MWRLKSVWCSGMRRRLRGRELRGEALATSCSAPRRAGLAELWRAACRQAARVGLAKMPGVAWTWAQALEVGAC